MQERLQKILAEGGFGSRRECETLILEGRVEVDREIVLQLGTKVDPENQSIRVDGQKLKSVHKKYFAVNKPRGVVSTNKDPSGRMRVVDLISTDQRIYTVGRLDKDSEGLIVVTNDGALANRLTHPRYGIEKTYLIQVEGHPTRDQMESLVSGVHLAEGFVQIKHYQFKRKQKHTTEIEIVLDEGRNREVRRLLARIGHKVLFLRRIAIGSYVMEGIPFGGNRSLNKEEIELLETNPKRRQAKRKTSGRSGGLRKKASAKKGAVSGSRKKATRGPGKKSDSQKKSVQKKGTDKSKRKKSVRKKVSGGSSTGRPSTGRSGARTKKSSARPSGSGRSSGSTRKTTAKKPSRRGRPKRR